MRTCKGRRGFSLIETLISLVILAIALLSLAAVPVVTTRALLLSDQRAKAAFFAASALDLGESANYQDPKNSDFGAYGVSDDARKLFSLTSLDLTGTYQVTLGFYSKTTGGPSWNSQPDYVQAEVSWSDVLGRSNPLELSRDLGPSSHLVVSDDT